MPKVAGTCERCHGNFLYYPSRALGRFCSRICRHPPFETRFWESANRATPDECWIWSGSVVRGYGRIGWNGRTWKAHRASWVLHHGREIPDGMCVCHACDTPPCVNPKHLHLGDHAANMAEMSARNRGRYPRGADTITAKLTDDHVRSILLASRGGATQMALAKTFSVSQTTVSLVARGKSWKHITRAPVLR